MKTTFGELFGVCVACAVMLLIARPEFIVPLLCVDFMWAFTFVLRVLWEAHQQATAPNYGIYIEPTSDCTIENCTVSW